MDPPGIDTSNPLEWGTSRIRMPIRLVSMNQAGNDSKAKIKLELKACLMSGEPTLDERTIETEFLLKLTDDMYEAMSKGYIALRVQNECDEILDLAMVSLMTAKSFGPEGERADNIATRPIGHYKRRKDEVIKAVTDAQYTYWIDNGDYIWFDTAICGYNMAVMEYLARGGYTVLFLCLASQLPVFEKIGAEQLAGVGKGRGKMVVMSLEKKWRMGSRL